MRLFRIGDKVVSLEKLTDAVSAILGERERGATQGEVARRFDVQRTFVSFLETIGEIRHGPRVALVGFPIANAAAVKSLAEEYALDFTLVLSQAEREGIESGDATKVFNLVLETLADLRDYDVIVFMGSDRRIRTVERILGREVLGWTLGPSPLRTDVEIDLGELRAVLDVATSGRDAEDATDTLDTRRQSSKR